VWILRRIVARRPVTDVAAADPTLAAALKRSAM